MLSPPSRPLVVTLTLDKTTQSFLTDLRSTYFPPHRNFLSAHVTIFHAIPPDRFDDLDRKIRDICQSTRGWDIFVCDPAKMGHRGVLVTVRESPSRMTERMHQDLLKMLQRGDEQSHGSKCTEQDLRPIGKPHITILNKVDDENQVDKCLTELKAVFDGLEHGPGRSGQKRGRAVGLDVWEYMGGPWKPLKAYRFKQDS